MVEASKPVNLGQLSAELGGVALWSSGPAGAVAAHVAEPTPDTPDVPSWRSLRR
jgi:hypothetical protein